MTNSKDGQALISFFWGFHKLFAEQCLLNQPQLVDEKDGVSSLLGWGMTQEFPVDDPLDDWMIPWQVLYFNVLSGERVTQETVKNCLWKDWSCPMAWHTWLAEVEGQMAQVLIVYGTFG